MGGKVLEYVIRAKDATAAAINSARDRISNFASSSGKRMAGLATTLLKNAANIHHAFQLIGTAANALWTQMQKAIQFEKLTWQFKTLVGSLDEARAHMRMLQDLGRTPPFSLDEFAKASRAMMTMSEGVLGFRKSLELAGDAAAATGKPLENIAHEIGRAYAVIRDGQPLERATMALRNMGIITPEVAAKLADMQKEGASSFAMWEALTAHIGRFKGAMSDTEQTVDGLIGAIKGEAQTAVTELGMAFLGVANGGLKGLMERLKQLNDSGDVAAWAAGIKQHLEDLVRSFSTLIEKAQATGSTLKQLWDYTGGAVVNGARAIGGTVGSAIGATVGTVREGGDWAMWKEAFRNGMSETDEAIRNSGLYRRMHGTYGVGKADAAQREQERSDAARAAIERRKAEQIRGEEQAAEEADKIRAAMEAGDAKRAEEAARIAAEEERRLQEKLAEEQRRRMEELERERERLAEKAYRKEVELAEGALVESQKTQGDAQSRLADARSQVARAWGWYRNQDSMQAHIDDILEQREAEKQWEKDFEKLKSRARGNYDWRTVDVGELSAHDEAVRQVALAKEEEAAAQKALDEIAENTRDLAGKLDELLSMKEA